MTIVATGIDLANNVLALHDMISSVVNPVVVNDLKQLK